MDLFALLELCQLRAIHAALEPSSESLWRMKCRQYSERFHTPLHVVMDLEPTLILTALFESEYHPSTAGEDAEELLETLYEIQDPNYQKVDPQETEDLVDMVMNRELARMEKKKALTQQTIVEEIVKEEAKKAHKPKSGKMDFSSLEKMESREEEGTAGFDK